jgi:hypothetical protein
MNKFRTLIVVGIATLIAACASTAPKPAAAPPPPAAPAAINLAGTWIVTTDSSFGSQDTKMTVTQNGQNLTGKLESPMGAVDYTGTVVGKDVKFGFQFNAQGTDLKIDYAGTTDGSTMEGKVVIGTFGEGTFKGKKQ